jgi:membrane protease YdiL (CAAX protease family)
VKTAALVGLIAGLLAVTTVLSPPIASVLDALGFTFRFSRVYNRVFEVLLVIALALGWRRLDLGGPEAWGLRRSGWARELRIGITIGLAGIGLALVVAWVGGGLVPDLRYDVPKTIRKASAGLVGALLVGVFEEVLFRGVLLRRFVLDLGPRVGVPVTTVVYAVVHGLRGGGKITASDWWAGWARTSSLFAPLGDALVWPGIAGLFVLGLVFAGIRQRTGSLWMPIGIHAAWVGVFRVGRLFFDIRRRPAWLVGPGWPPLVGGLAGAIAIATTVVLARTFLRRHGDFRRHSP